MPQPRDLLSSLLGEPLPPGLSALSDTDLATLVEAIEAAEAHQRVALSEAVDHGLSIVPRVLRGTVRKALFG